MTTSGFWKDDSPAVWRGQAGGTEKKRGRRARGYWSGGGGEGAWAEVPSQTRLLVSHVTRRVRLTSL